MRVLCTTKPVQTNEPDRRTQRSSPNARIYIYILVRLTYTYTYIHVYTPPVQRIPTRVPVRVYLISVCNVCTGLNDDALTLARIHIYYSSICVEVFLF